MKISASIYSSKSNDFENLIIQLDDFGVDYFHIDSNENLNVFNDISTIRDISKTPIDLHIISSNPEKYFNLINEFKIEKVTFQVENLNSKVDFSKIKYSETGIAISNNTQINVYEKYANVTSFIMFMTTTPGESGGKFNINTFRKIREFKKLFPGKKIHVDGGVNNENAFILKNLGVFCSVSGSYLVNSDDILSSLLNLKSNKVYGEYKAIDFMHDVHEIPVLNENDVDLKNVLLVMEKFKLGFCIINDVNNKLKGIITEGDIRRELLINISKSGTSNFKIKFNENPHLVNELETLPGIIEGVINIKREINFIPIVDFNSKLKGAIIFNNLTKAEI